MLKKGVMIGVCEKSKELAFTRPQLLAIIGVILLLVILVLLPAVNKGRTKATRINCVNNLKNIGLGFRIFAPDNQDLFPFDLMTNGTRQFTNASDAFRHFAALSNSIGNMKIFVCPADKHRTEARSWATFSNSNLSYFININASETYPQMMLSGDRDLWLNGRALSPGKALLTSNEIAQLTWGNQVHTNFGAVVMGDGSVQQLSSGRLQEIARGSAVTNVLLIP